MYFKYACVWSICMSFLKAAVGNSFWCHLAKMPQEHFSQFSIAHNILLVIEEKTCFHYSNLQLRTVVDSRFSACTEMCGCYEWCWAAHLSKTLDIL